MSTADRLDHSARAPRLPWPWSWWWRRAARRALDRCYDVPYLRELSASERRGMLLLEAAGEVQRDDGFSGTHWHRRWL